MNTFSVGIPWRYEDTFKTEYCVKPHYSDLKSEIMEYSDIPNVKKNI